MTLLENLFFRGGLSSYFAILLSFQCLKVQNLLDMTKPWLVKVGALFVKKEDASFWHTPFMHFMLAVSLVFSEWECSVTDCIFLSAAALRFYIGFPFGRRTLFLHSHCCLALCEPAATELKSKNAHGASRIFNGVFYTDSFFDFLFLIYLLILIVPWQDKWDFRRIILLILSAY